MLVAMLRDRANELLREREAEGLDDNVPPLVSHLGDKWASMDEQHRKVAMMKGLLKKHATFYGMSAETEIRLTDLFKKAALNGLSYKF
jgi:hypothetical protein